MPFSIYSNGNLNGYNAGTQYVDVVGNPYAGQNSAHWINPAAFQEPADGTYGTVAVMPSACPGSKIWTAA